MSSTTPSRMAPNRNLREGEKKELQELNNRLEMYIIQQREREASLENLRRELDAQRQKHEAEKEHANNLHQTEINVIRKKREEQDLTISGLQHLLQERNGSVDGLSQQLNIEKSNASSQRKYANQLENDLKNAQAINVSTSQALIEAQHDLETLNGNSQALNDELKRARKRVDDLTTEASRANSRAKALDAQLKLMQQQMNTECDSRDRTIIHLQNLLHALQPKLLSEDELRALFDGDLKKAEDLKVKAIQDLKDAYDDKIKNLRDMIDALNNELEAERAKNAVQNRTILNLNDKAKEDAQAKDKMAARIKDLEDQLAFERDAPNEIIARKNDTIKRIQDAFKRKDEELDALMDVNAALQLEIDALGAMIESEEDRLGLNAGPPNKRRRTEGNEQGKSNGSAEPEAERAPVEELQAAPAPMETDSHTPAPDSDLLASPKPKARGGRGTPARRQSSRALPRTNGNGNGNGSAPPLAVPVPVPPRSDRKLRSTSKSSLLAPSASPATKRSWAPDSDAGHGDDDMNPRYQPDSNAEAKEVPVEEDPEVESEPDHHDQGHDQDRDHDKELKPETEPQPEEVSYLFSDYDSEGHHVTIRSNSANAVQLDGWKLTSRETGLEFTFPRVSLRAGQAFVVRTKLDATSPDTPSDQFTAYVDPELWSPYNDLAQLVSPTGQVVASVEVKPSGGPPSSGKIVTNDASLDEKQKCSIM